MLTTDYCVKHVSIDVNEEKTHWLYTGHRLFGLIHVIKKMMTSQYQIQGLQPPPHTQFLDRIWIYACLSAGCDISPFTKSSLGTPWKYLSDHVCCWDAQPHEWKKVVPVIFDHCFNTFMSKSILIVGLVQEKSTINWKRTGMYHRPRNHSHVQRLCSHPMETDQLYCGHMTTAEYLSCHHLEQH